jgi:hypothetical protein
MLLFINQIHDFVKKFAILKKNAWDGHAACMDEMKNS